MEVVILYLKKKLDGITSEFDMHGLNKIMLNIRAW